MKIAEIRTYLMDAPLERPFAYSQAWFDRRAALLVEVVAEDGLSGWGECFGPMTRAVAGAVEFLKPALVGQDAMATEALWQAMYNRTRDHGQKGVAIEALSGIDIALWDLKGKALDLPIHRLMGGPLRSRVQAYATGFYRTRDPNQRDRLVAEAERHVADGYAAFKLKLGFGVADDIGLCEAVRKRVGDKVAIMVDANHAYDATAAIRLGRAIERLDIGWFEEPVPPEDVEGYRQVKSALAIPIAGGEAEFTRWGFRRLLAERALDVAQPDTCAVGGISECKKIADMASAFGVRTIPHCWGSGVAVATALQMLAVIPHTPPALQPIEPLLEFDRSEHPYRMAVVKSPIVPRDGWVDIPTGPGLGIEIDRDAVRRYSVA
ncbi:MAG: mandelate racemase/muconate lactonizing enzyme family protein [Alphaproteobacteria bacterium]|nr:mandelate racemase/muconate lactonizing enzyme family protein [Alphaproteobacteria bacterium]